ncbi:hypothetical protein EDB81DRAFT_168234 [Dactylonectria macrodidyma]|uniref:Uncharacterized protein n=1 Tax=Dactylonectria macrodidyma TaxID=307937 RepID=A0A9P9FRM0_9HYPO|nr:hypothetical protein EDB81DRAFT_168234 [Dactylonectria macrodidyma]
MMNINDLTKNHKHNLVEVWPCLAHSRRVGIGLVRCGLEQRGSVSSLALPWLRGWLLTIMMVLSTYAHKARYNWMVIWDLCLYAFLFCYYFFFV